MGGGEADKRERPFLPCYLRHRVPARLGRKRGSQQRSYSEAFYVSKGCGCGLESLEPKKCADDLIKSSSPPQRNRAGDPGAELLAAVASHDKRLVDAFDEDAPVLDRFDAVRDLDDAARGGGVELARRVKFMIWLAR